MEVPAIERTFLLSNARLIILRRCHVENAIRNAVIKFEQEFMGLGPDEVRAFLVRDLVVVHLKGV